MVPRPGYLNAGYAHSLAEFGRPLELANSGGWILEREIPESHRRDATGCYPIFVCQDWAALPGDLEGLADDLVTLTLVTDPFANPDAFKGCFQVTEPFKEHLVVDLSLPSEERSSRHHRYYARWARKHNVEVERAENPIEHLDEWSELYANLCARHNIRGMRAFSREAFRLQLALPGAVMFRAIKDGQAVAAHVWFIHGERAYSHLQASSGDAYTSRAAYALYDAGLAWLAERCSDATLGAGPGAVDRSGGLTTFKRGWATGIRTSYLCCQVFDGQAYEALSRRRDASESLYFPAYRAGEMA